ncbi:MFS transporter [Streptomyces sp. NPDC002896]|uniref:MFS transporter n=1 Tax=Streptomyces sp. NPDC002896 TaxID=3154438 RepID=UPI00332D4BB0
MTIQQVSPQPTGGQAGGDRRTQTKRVYLASLIGTTVEFYDFIVFGVAASLVFGRVFFESASPAVGTIASFATLAIGYGARPLGGIIFGHFGDRLGRKKMLIWTMLLMGTSTFLIGFLPSSQQIGSIAPVLLVLLRLVQGIAVGGEWGGAVLMSVEHAPKKRRGLFGGAVGLGSGTGTLLAYAAFGAMNNLSDEDFLAWGWRVPFLASIVIVAVGMYVRLRVEESPVFVSEQQKKRNSQTTSSKPTIPLVALFRERPGRVLLAAAVTSGPFMAQAIITTSLIAYATSEYDIPRNTLLTLLNVALVVMLATIPVFSWINDKIGRRTLYCATAVCFAVFAFFMFPMVGTGSSPMILLTFVLGMAVFNAAGTATSGTLLSELFPTAQRYTGAGVAYQLSGLIGGGVGPLFASMFLAPSGPGPIAVAGMVAGFCLLSATCTLFVGDNRKLDLQDA